MALQTGTCFASALEIALIATTAPVVLQTVSILVVVVVVVLSAVATTFPVVKI
jgi:hypothetical protein